MTLALTAHGYEQLLSAPDDVNVAYRTWHRATFRADEYIVAIELHDPHTIVVTTDTTYEHPAGRGFAPDTGETPDRPTTRTDLRITAHPFPVDALRPYLTDSET